MIRQLPTEFFLHDQPGSIDQVEWACAFAADNPVANSVALAVDPVHVARASELLFGTGIGVVSTLDASERPARQEAIVRRSLAAGATEIALVGAACDWRAVANLQAILGSSAQLTVAVVDAMGNLDLAAAERALLEGVDYVAYTPASLVVRPDQVASLLTLAKEVRLGRVKLAHSLMAQNSYAAVVEGDDWAIGDRNVRLCVALPDLGLDRDDLLP